MSESYRDSHVGKGKDYHAMFHDAPWTSMMWSLEQEVLDDVVRRHFPQEGPVHMDFACGTGRVFEHLRSKAKEQVGVDISPTMLDTLRERLPDAQLVCGDLTRDDILQGQQFSLATAFRFFPNAEDALRKDAVEAVARHLVPGGLLVFNNHFNTASLRSRLGGMLGRPAHKRCMSPEQVEQVLAWGGLELVEDHGLGILPLNDRRMLPGPIASIERALSAVPGLKSLGIDRIYVARKPL